MMIFIMMMRITHVKTAIKSKKKNDVDYSNLSINNDLIDTV
jgi:hypothetical protein